MLRRVLRNLFAGSLFTIAGLGSAGTFAADQAVEALREFLTTGNRQEGVYVSELHLRQGGRLLPWYEQTGNEERRANLRRRPILTPVDPCGPFGRGREVVARVERGQGLEIQVKLERIRLEDGAREIARDPVDVLYVYLTPGQDLERRLTSVDGRYLISIPAKPDCSRVRCQVRSGDDRHELSLAFINRRLPVTLVPRTPE